MGAICSSEVSFEADFEHFEGQARHFDFEIIGAMLFDDTILMSLFLVFTTGFCLLSPFGSAFLSVLYFLPCARFGLRLESVAG